MQILQAKSATTVGMFIKLVMVCRTVFSSHSNVSLFSCTYSNGESACCGNTTDIGDGECNGPMQCWNATNCGVTPATPLFIAGSRRKFADKEDFTKYSHSRTRTRTRASRQDNVEPKLVDRKDFPTYFPTPTLPSQPSNVGNDLPELTDEPTSSSNFATQFPTASKVAGTPTPTYAPSGDSEATGGVTTAESGCTQDLCTVEVSDDCTLAYRVNNGLTITMELTCDGSDEWVGIGFSNDGKMQNSEAVLGVPGNQPLKYALNGKYTAAVIQMPTHKQTLTDATLEVDQDGRTVMKFTKILKEQGEIEIRQGENILLYARGMASSLGYHPNRSSFKLTL